MDKNKERYLKRKATEIRLHGMEAIHSIRNGHVGGSLSIADILAVLYFDAMNVYPENPIDPKRDRFVLSKGHCTPTAYAALAMKGFFPMEELMTFRRIDSRLSGHMCMEVPGVDASTGSLGQGLSVAVGIALAGMTDKLSYKVYVVCGDGEIEEGQIWEATMAAAKYHLDNLCLFIDYNQIQLDDRLENIAPELLPIEEKFKAFGWNVLSIDGHDVCAIGDAVDEFTMGSSGKPTVVVAHTIKGKGVGIFENQIKWHGSVPTEEEFRLAFAELHDRLNALEGNDGN